MVRCDMSEQETTKRETTSIKIKPALWKETKIEAIREGKTTSEVVEAVLEEWLKEKRKK